MGLTESVRLQTQPWIEDDWQPLQRQIISFSKTRTLQSIKNGALIDQYQLMWQSLSEFQFYLKSFNWRNKRKNQSHIVGSIGLKLLIGGDMCSNKVIANVYLEHIALRLSQIDQIPLSGSLYIVLTALQGYQELYNHSGYFRVQEQQICIDRLGKVKVWLNKDLSKNYTEVDIESQGLRRNQIHMVRQIVEIVEQNTDRDQILQPSLSEYLIQLRKKEGKEIGFQYAQVAVLEYAKMNKVTILNKLDAATELYQSDLYLAPSQSANNFQLDRLNQKLEIKKSAEIQVNNQQLKISHQSMPNLHSPRQCNFQYVSQYPQFSSQTNVDANKYIIPSQNHIINHSTNRILRENIVQTTLDQFIPQSSIHLTEMNPCQVQLSSTTKRTANTQSHLACLEQASTHSIRVDQRDDRNTMKSMPLREPFQNFRHRIGNQQQIRYSQCLQEDRKNHFNTIKINHDSFGLTNQQKRFMKQISNSSYKFESSNSSKRSKSRKQKQQSRRGSSPSHRERNSRRQSFPSGKEEAFGGRKYFVSLGQYGFLDPEIQADMLKFLG